VIDEGSTRASLPGDYSGLEQALLQVFVFDENSRQFIAERVFGP
jgi:hypothetical protein